MKWKAFVFLALFFAGQTCAFGSHTKSLFVLGKVSAANHDLAGAEVELYEAGVAGATRIGSDRTNRHGWFVIRSRPSKGALLYLTASKPDRPELVLAATLGPADSCAQMVRVNELTTVATVYALSQFLDGTEFFGPSPGLDNAMATTQNLVNPQSGRPARIVSNYQNGSHRNPRSTRALQTQNSLANLVAACAADPANCDTLFALTTVDGQAPGNTLEALHNIARNPVGLDNGQLFDLATVEEVYKPGLDTAPRAWMLALHFTRGGFNAPGRFAFDFEGNLWSNNNWMPPAGNPWNIPGRQITVLNPRGKPILGSPIFSRYVNGSGYGTAVGADQTAWISNFDDGGITQFSPRGRVINHASGLDHPMGMAFDQDGNLWIPNMGDPADPADFGSVTVFLQGDPSQRRHAFEGIHKPFSLAIDGQGRAWVANGGVGPVGSVTILELTPDSVVKVVQKDIKSDAMAVGPDELRPFGDFASSRTIAIDSAGNGWVANFFTNQVTFVDGTTFEPTDYPVAEGTHGWGLAVDGSDVVWVQSFSNPPTSPTFHSPPDISVVQGAGPDRGFLFSFSNPSLQHVTALQIDSSGNVWVANNWSLETTIEPLAIFGGDGVVQFIGLATPVLTPLIGPPVNPADLIGP